MSKTPWTPFYAENVPHKITLKHKNAAELIKEKLNQFSDRDAYTNFGTTKTYAEIEKDAIKFANHLQSLGLPQGARIGLALPNVMQYAVALFGTWYAGMTVVNMSPLYKSDYLSHLINSAECDAVVVTNLSSRYLWQARWNADVKKRLKHIIVTEVGDMLESRWERTKINTGAWILNLFKVVPRWFLGKTYSFNQALKNGAKQSSKPIDVGLNDTALIQMSGGTTGMPSSVILTHESILSNVAMFDAWVGIQHEESHIAVTAIPCFHVFGSNVALLGAVNFGALNILITNPKDVKGLVDKLRGYSITALAGVDALYGAWLKNPDFHKLDFSELKVAIAGATPLQKKTSDAFHALTQVRIRTGYGLTQMGPGVTMQQVIGTEDDSYNPSVGHPLPSVLVEIRNDEGEPIWEPGKRGRIFVKGPNLTTGYHNNPKKTAAELIDGWLDTADAGEWNERYELLIVGRYSDMINPNNSGLNVYPDEVEKAIISHKDVIKVACFRAFNKGSEAVKVVVYTKNKSLTRKDLFQYYKNTLEEIKQPYFIEFMYDSKEYFMTNVGKTDRKAFIAREEKRSDGQRAQEKLDAKDKRNWLMRLWRRIAS